MSVDVLVFTHVFGFSGPSTEVCGILVDLIIRLVYSRL